MTCRIIQIKEMKPQYDPGNGNPLSKAIFDEINLLFYEYGKGGEMTMMEPKFPPFLTDHTKKQNMDMSILNFRKIHHKN